MDKLRARKILSMNASKQGYTLQMRTGSTTHDRVRVLNSSKQVIAEGTLRKDDSGYDSHDVHGIVRQLRSGDFNRKTVGMNCGRGEDGNYEACVKGDWLDIKQFRKGLRDIQSALFAYWEAAIEETKDVNSPFYCEDEQAIEGLYQASEAVLRYLRALRRR